MTREELAAMLNEGAQDIEINGTPSQVGPSPSDLREAATAILTAQAAERGLDAGVVERTRISLGEMIMLFCDGDNDGHHGGDHHQDGCFTCETIARAQDVLKAFREAAALHAELRKDGSSYAARLDPQEVIPTPTPSPAGWQDIGTAPKDGTLILGWIKHVADEYCEEDFERPSLISWVEYGPKAQSWGTKTGWDQQWIGTPTHWMPLPDQPISGGEDERGPVPKPGEIRTFLGQRCRFIEREMEGDKWEVL